MNNTEAPATQIPAPSTLGVIDCGFCGRTSHWCHCDTHPVATAAERKAEAITFLASIGLDANGKPLPADKLAA